MTFPAAAIHDSDPDEDYADDDKRKVTLDRRDENLADLLLENGLGRVLRYNRTTKVWYAWRRFYWSDDEAHAYNLLLDHVHALLGATKSKAKADIISPLLDARKQDSVMKVLSRREEVRIKGDEFDQVEN